MCIRDRLNTERVEAADADAAWRAGLMLHLGTLKGVVQQDEGISLRATLQLQGLNLVSRLDRRVMLW